MSKEILLSVWAGLRDVLDSVDPSSSMSHFCIVLLVLSLLWREGLHHKMKFSQASLSFLVFKPSSERTQNPVTVIVVTKAWRLQGPRQAKSLLLQGLSWHCVSATNSTGTHVVLRHHVIQTPLEFKNYGPDFFLFLF